MISPNIANTPHKTFTPEKAIQVAEELNASDDWFYVVIHDPTGRGLSFIEIYETPEKKNFIDRWK